MDAHGETPFRWPRGHGFVVGWDLPLSSSHEREFPLRKFALPKASHGERGGENDFRRAILESET